MKLMRSVRPVLTVFLIFSLLFPGISSGQAIGMKRGDSAPPEVIHTPLTEITPGMPIRIQAMVTDNVGVNEVILSYRQAGSDQYKQIRMLEAPGRNIYSADLPMIAGASIEYFIQASDDAGNTISQRQADPYVITTPPVAVATTDIVQPPGFSEEPEQEPAEGGVSNWVWIGLGVLALGAVAMSSGGGGGGGSGNDEPGETGTVTITGPAP